MSDQIKPATRHYFTAGELREALAELPADTPIYVRGYEDGVNYATELVRVRVFPFVNSGTWYYGEHEVSHCATDDTLTEEGYELAGDHLNEGGNE